jgi:hypothetical protein
MRVFDAHEEADAGHVLIGAQMIARAPELSGMEQDSLEATVETTLLFIERLHEGVLREFQDQ